MAIIGVDVDLVVANSDKTHLKWLQDLGSYSSPIPIDNIDYDLGKYFVLPRGLEGMDYWRLDDIYDEHPSSSILLGIHLPAPEPVTPIPGAIEVLEYLHKKGHEIVFISHVKGNHHKSKVRWLKRNFPFMSGFIATKEKHYVNSGCDIFIDDRNDHLNASKAKLNIKFKTPYTQYVRLDSSRNNIHSATSWDSIKYIIDRYLYYTHRRSV